MIQLLTKIILLLIFWGQRFFLLNHDRYFYIKTIYVLRRVAKFVGGQYTRQTRLQKVEKKIVFITRSFQDYIFFK